jgi:uncharacterized protein DUF397
MRDGKLVDVPFRKSSFSPIPLVYCVEVGVRNELIRVRDSKDRDGGELTFNAGEWDAFVRGVKAGEFDF